MDKFQLYYPCKPFGLNQGFGQNLNGFYKELGMKGHNGWDLLAPDGKEVRATHAGVVIATGYDGSGGLSVELRTLKTFDYNGTPVYFRTIYYHLKAGSVCVNPDQIVQVGDLLARADNTGKYTTGSHLHFGLKPQQRIGQDKDPWYFINLGNDNGYAGAIDPSPYWTGTYAEDQANLTRERIIRLLQALTRLFHR